MKITQELMRLKEILTIFLNKNAILSSPITETLGVYL